MMTAPHIVDPAGLLGQALAEASPDLSDWSILVHELSASLSTKFASISLKNVITWHEPGGGLMVYTDQEVHCQHSSWRQLIESVGGIQSLSRKGNCYDNAVMENFFGHLKTEM
ncbi:hypothetical protein EBF03_00340 [Arcanobacterium haemolyticum]|nr:hypothetical protein EBF03_00340 [Arcanobacterium haemolyticum]